ncbi:MAG: carbohydrate ABC transporter permease [Bacteroidota bacterium]
MNLTMGILKKRSTWDRINRWGLLFIIPALLYFGIFKFYPMFHAFYLSFFQSDLINRPTFTGLANYISLFSDRLFLQSVGASVFYVLGTCIPIWILSLALALLVVGLGRGKNLIRLLYFIPVIMSQIPVALVWKFMYHPMGLINTFLQYFGFGQINWLTDAQLAMPALLIPGIWRGTPYFMVIFMAGLQAIPEQYYEAARIDGATGWKAFRHVTLPLLKNTTILVVIMSLIIGLKVFLNPKVMTGGGPSGATRVLPLLIYQTGFEFFKMGYASAMSMIMFAAIMFLTLIQFKIFKAE